MTASTRDRSRQPKSDAPIEALRPLAAEELRALEEKLRCGLAAHRSRIEPESVLVDAEGIDRWLETVGVAALVASLALQEVAGLLLGWHLAKSLGLEWVRDESDREIGVRPPASRIVFYPFRMVASQLRQELSLFGETDRSPRLGWLVASTRDYLKNLNRFHPSQT